MVTIERDGNDCTKDGSELLKIGIAYYDRVDKSKFQIFGSRRRQSMMTIVGEDNNPAWV